MCLLNGFLQLKQLCSCSSFLLLLLLLLTLLSSTQYTNAAIAIAEEQSIADPEHRLCESIDIKQIEDFEKIQFCQTIVGHVSIRNIDFVELADSDIQQIRTIVQEITDYLFIYRVHGLESLEHIFPDLVLIRGRRLLFEEYALVIFENRKLNNIGLVDLKRIDRGSVRIQGNPELCYADTVNWIALFRNSSQQHFSIKHNRLPNHCPTCPVSTEEHDSLGGAVKKHCWHENALQKIVQPGNQCLDICEGEDRAYCSPHYCGLCANLNQNGKCVDNCGVTYFELFKRKCIKAATCTAMGRIPLVRGGVCLDKISFKNYDTMTCNGTFKIKNSKDLQQIKGCVTITGSLLLQLTESKSHIIRDLEEALASLKEITGYLKIVHSPQIVSFSFLSNLDTIRGSELYANQYALYVVDNYHLEEIWRKNQKVAIIRGQVFFHLNPRLCYEKILALQPTIHSSTNITILNASPNSNGERVICGNAVRKLNAVVEDVNATVALITVDNMPAEDLDVLLGYSYYYKPAPNKNVTMYDGRHGCGHDDWRLDISASKNRRHLIKNLRPFTQYAYFVKTITKVDYHKQIEAYSDIKYFRTLPSKPGPVAKIYYHSISASQIAVHWWPPRTTNGIIDKYIINYSVYEMKKGKANETLTRPETIDPKNCQCENVIENTNSVSPNDENYYNKDEKIYEEALPNMIFVARSQEPKNMSSDTGNSKSSSTVRPQNNLTKKSIEFWEEYNKKVEENARQIQNADKATFFVQKPKSICLPTENPKLDECVPLETFSGVTVAGTKHSYILRQLEGEVTYRITVRACVRGLQNGCGAESSIFAETVSKRLETFLKSINDYK